MFSTALLTLFELFALLTRLLPGSAGTVDGGEEAAFEEEEETFLLPKLVLAAPGHAPGLSTVAEGLP